MPCAARVGGRLAPAVVAVTVGGRTTTRLPENTGAADIELTDADLRHITEILPHGSAGSRRPAAMMSHGATD